MPTIPMSKDLLKSFDYKYILKFVILFVPLYYFHIAFRGITDPKNLYSPFVDQHLNYIAWFEGSILKTSNIIVHFEGLKSYVIGNIIRIENGASVLFWPACAGLGIISFWIAFVVSHKLNWKIKLFWTLIGVFAIWFINTWRIAILLIALQNRWNATRYIDHHDMFNIVAYILIIGLIYLFNSKKNKYIVSDKIETEGQRDKEN